VQECRITIPLFKAERDALFELAHHERRDTRGQAAILVRQELAQRGLLPQEQPTEHDPHAEALTFVTVRLKGAEYKILEMISSLEGLGQGETICLLLHQEADRRGVPPGSWYLHSLPVPEVAYVKHE